MQTFNHALGALFAFVLYIIAAILAFISGLAASLAEKVAAFTASLAGVVRMFTAPLPQVPVRIVRLIGYNRPREGIVPGVGVACAV